MFDEQKEFLCYLTASVPSQKELRRWIEYKEKINKIEETDYSQKLSYSADMLKAGAIAEEISLKEYTKRLSDITKNKELRKINIEYYGEENVLKDEMQKEKDKFDSFIAQIESKMENPWKQFDKPDFLKK